MSDVLGTLAAVAGDAPAAEAPVLAPVETADETPRKSNTLSQLREQLVGKRNERGQFLPKDEAEPVAEAAPPEPKVEEKKAEEPKESAVKLQHARALQDVKKLTVENVDLKGKVTSYEAKVKAFESNPLKAMEDLTGRKFMDIMKDAAAGKYDVAQVPDAIRAELDEIKKFRQEQQEAQQAQATAAQRTADTGTIKAFLESHKDDFPAFASLDWAVDDLLDNAYKHLKETGEQPDLRELAKEAESNALKGLTEVFKNENLLTQALRDPDTRARVQKLLGGQGQLRAVAPAATLSNKTTQEAPATPPAAERELTEDEVLRQAQVRFAALRKAGGMRLT